MAYITGSEHLLYVAKETSFNVTPTVFSSTNFPSQVPMFMVPGSRPSVQMNVIDAEGIGFVAGRGRARSLVTGNYSFYFDTTKQLSIFMNNICDSTDGSFIEQDSSSTNSLCIIGIMKGAQYFINGAFVTGITINASDSNSLITLDVSIVAAKIQLLKSSNPTPPASMPLVPNFIGSTTGQMTKFEYGDTTAAEGNVNGIDFFQINTVNDGFRGIPFTGLTVTLQKPMQMPTFFGASASELDSNTVPDRAKLIQHLRRPVASGNKTMTASCTVPYNTTNATAGTDWVAAFNKIIGGEIQKEQGTMAFQFKGSDNTTAIFTLNNFEFTGLDYTTIDDEIIEYPLAINAYTKDGSLGSIAGSSLYE